MGVSVVCEVTGFDGFSLNHVVFPFLHARTGISLGLEMIEIGDTY